MTSLARAALFVLAACTSSRAPAPAAPAPAEPAEAPTAGATAPAALPPAFAASLAAARMSFAVPAGFTLVAPVDNPHWQYPFAMRADDGSVEVRVRIDDLGAQRAEEAACKARPGCVRASTNELWRTWHFAIAANIAGARPDAMPEIQELDRADVASDFGGDAAALALVDVDAKFGAQHPHGLVAIIHKDDRAAAVVVLLFDDPTQVDFERAFGGLRFEP